MESLARATLPIGGEVTDSGPAVARAMWAAFGGIGFIGMLDWITSREVSLSFLYVLPMGLGAWRAGWKGRTALSVMGAATWFAVDRLGGRESTHPFIPYGNGLLHLGFFLLFTDLVARVSHLTTRLHVLARELPKNPKAEPDATLRKDIQGEMAELHLREQECLANELHDDLGAYLGGVAFRAKIVAEKLARRNAPESSEAQALVHRINGGIDKVRLLASRRMPVEPVDPDLLAALSRVGADAENTFGITCSLQAEPNLPRLSTEHAVQLSRIAQEAVWNAVRHAQADPVRITVGVGGDCLVLIIENDGSPWAPAQSTPARGLGLRIMKQRAERIGGTLSISIGDRSGTRVVCRVPLRLMDCSGAGQGTGGGSP